MQINWKNKYGDSRYGYLFKPLDYGAGEKISTDHYDLCEWTRGV